MWKFQITRRSRFFGGWLANISLGENVHSPAENYRFARVLPLMGAAWPFFAVTLLYLPYITRRLTTAAEERGAADLRRPVQKTAGNTTEALCVSRAVGSSEPSDAVSFEQGGRALLLLQTERTRPVVLVAEKTR